MSKILEDRWNGNPPQVTSLLTYPRRPVKHSHNPKKLTRTHLSPICGFGWRFEFTETFQYKTSESDPRAQELIGTVAVEFQPNLCSSMSLHSLSLQVKVTYPPDKTNTAYNTTFPDVSMEAHLNLGKYEEPPRYTGQTHFEITVTFNTADGLSLPTSPSVNIKEALRTSLDGPSFVDTKFYLYSAKSQGQPALPRAVFAKSLLLNNASSYFRDMLSSETGFESGTPCDLRDDVFEEINKLKTDTYDYDSDSDLESLPDEERDDLKESAALGKQDQDRLHSPTSTTADQPEASTTAPERQAESPNNATKSAIARQDGRAFAINGTAYRTWKAFIFYTYTNEVLFSPLKSQGPLAPGRAELVSCSPKSMYRFADYADLPMLKTLAKDGIDDSLYQDNIITELFSNFTSRYQELVELEVNFLVQNFTPAVARELDEMLQLIVLGTKPHCYRVLAFTMRRLRGESTQSAWDALAQYRPFPSFPPPSPPPARASAAFSSRPGSPVSARTPVS